MVYAFNSLFGVGVALLGLIVIYELPTTVKTNMVFLTFFMNILVDSS